jgi:hypothetical protein
MLTDYVRAPPAKGVPPALPAPLPQPAAGDRNGNGAPVNPAAAAANLNPANIQANLERGTPSLAILCFDALFKCFIRLGAQSLRPAAGLSCWACSERSSCLQVHHFIISSRPFVFWPLAADPLAPWGVTDPTQMELLLCAQWRERGRPRRRRPRSTRL